MPALPGCAVPLLLTLVFPFAAAPDIDQGLIILQRLAERLSLEMEVRITQLQALQTEKFRALEVSIQSNEKHFNEINVQQHVAIAKAEATTIDALKGLNTAVQDVERAFSDRLQGQSDRIQGLKERLDRMEGQATGISTSWGVIVAVIGIGVGVIGFVRSLRIPKAP